MKPTKTNKSEKQELIDIMFQVGLEIHNNKWFNDKDNIEVAEWIADQLRQCGYDTQPGGMSWGVLKDE